jgi:hypothetical protein
MASILFIFVCPIYLFLFSYFKKIEWIAWSYNI